MKKQPFKSPFFAVIAVFITLYASIAEANDALISDGSDGAFAISSPLTLPVPSSQKFNFTTFSILAGGTLDFSGVFSWSLIEILATGDVLIDGTLNAFPSKLIISTPGSITINGTLNFNDLLYLTASQINVNGVIAGSGDNIWINHETPTIVAQPGDAPNLIIPDPNAPIGLLPVPEPETYGMLLAGLGMVGFMARRRKTHKAA